MRLIMFGTGPFAVPTFEALIDSHHDVLALVTRPIADAGKRRKTAENPTRDTAQQRGIPIHDPASCNEADFVELLIEFQADLFVVCDYGQILSRKCLAAAKLGGINLHGSLLPRYRGAAPINWAIFNGDTVTGVTIIHMTPRLDGGPCLAKAELQIGATETAAEIEPKLAHLGVAPVMVAIEQLAAWDGQSPLGEPQDQAAATKAPRLQKADGQVDWSDSAQQIVNQVRAFQPWPGTFTAWHSETLKQPLRLIIHQATAFASPSDFVAAISATDAAEQAAEIDTSKSVIAGEVWFVDRVHLLIGTGNGLLSIEMLQPAGKRPMPTAEFLRGRNPQPKDQMA